MLLLAHSSGVNSTSVADDNSSSIQLVSFWCAQVTDATAKQTHDGHRASVLQR
jgi:hypothetical protein